MIQISRLSTRRPGRAIVEFYRSTIRLWLIAAVLVATTTPLIAHAITTLSEGYSTTEKLSIGSIVSLQKNTTDQVIAASTSNVDNLLGVVINENSSLLSVSNGNATQIQVATSGTVQVLVSDINGKIERGDHVTASPISGVGMKANGNVRVIGTAQGDAGKGTKQTYKNKSGQEQSANLSEIPVLVNVAYFFKEPNKTIIPFALQSVANALAGKTVSTLPILVSLGIFLITLIVVVSIIYSMIRSSIISVGRNPMSQSAIYRDLIQLSTLVLAILAVAIIAIYMILTRL
jgi:hypothetical protein